MDAITDIRHASRQLVRQWGFLRGRLDWVDVSHSQCHTLVELERHGILTVGELAQLLAIDKSTASRTVRSLIARDWVAVAELGGDQRAKPLKLTDAGRAQLAAINSGADAQVGQALSLLTPEQQAEVQRGLTLYARALQRQRALARLTVRPVSAADDEQVHRLIHTVMPEFGCTGPGFALNDPEVSAMSAAYAQPRWRYLVALRDGRVIGGGGIAPLDGGDPQTCELKKMYLLSDARGLGLGTRLLQQLLQTAREFGFTRCYLETLETMAHANKLYQKFGFERVSAPLGQTGHFSCNTFYTLDL